MAKRKETVEVIVSKLIIEKDKFEEQINERISKGKTLCDYPVKISSYGRDISGKVRPVYDEKEQANFLFEYKKWKQFNIELLKRSFNISDNEYTREYECEVRSFVLSDVVEEHKQDIKQQITVLESFLERLSLIPAVTEIIKQETNMDVKLTNKIFIVHGHNDRMKETVARTLTRLKLEPIILHEQVGQGRTIIEKFEDNSSNVNFAVILLTADDEGKAKEEADYKTRARQNVVFEMGYFIGKLGRKKVFLLLEDGVDKPGDLDGIVYVPIDPAGGWKLRLVQELKEAGYSVSADNIL
jgi:predicted nucleotide-binding protein